MASYDVLIDPVVVANLVAYVGKQLTFTMQAEDYRTGDVIPLTGYTASGKIYDENGTTVLDLSPTINADNGQYVVDVEVPSSIPAGRYDWVGCLIEADNDEHPRFRGRVDLRTY
jgi:hypothetical protein